MTPVCPRPLASSAVARGIEMDSGGTGPPRKEPEMSSLTNRARIPLAGLLAAVTIAVLAAAPGAVVLAVMPTAIEYAVML